MRPLKSWRDSLGVRPIPAMESEPCSCRYSPSLQLSPTTDQRAPSWHPEGWSRKTLCQLALLAANSKFRLRHEEHHGGPGKTSRYRPPETSWKDLHYHSSSFSGRVVLLPYRKTAFQAGDRRPILQCRPASSDELVLWFGECPARFLPSSQTEGRSKHEFPHFADGCVP